MPSRPKAKHLSPVSPAVRCFGPLELAIQKDVGHLKDGNPARFTTTGQAAKAAPCRCTGRLFLHLQLSWLFLQPESVSCTCSWPRQAKDRGGVSGRAEGSITSSGCAFLSQVAAELPEQLWQPYFQQDTLAHMAFIWGLVHQTVFTLLHNSSPSHVGWFMQTPLRVIIGAFSEKVREDKTMATMWRRGWGIRRLGLAWLPGFPLLTSTASTELGHVCSMSLAKEVIQFSLTYINVGLSGDVLPLPSGIEAPSLIYWFWWHWVFEI